MRAIRIRFLLASVVAVTNGLAISYWKTGQLNPFYAVLTYVGVICLHASVDLLNDYWDFKRGIDQSTTRTRFSGGTGVLPEKLLAPRAVYLAGIIFLILGASIGSYFVLVRGFTIAIILGFAIVSIYFYSTSIVNLGLGELFVGIKGAMIVLGSCYVQLGYVDQSALYTGAVVGLLSATVLFVNAIPDMEADSSKGRRTLVIILGIRRSVSIFPLLFAAAYLLIIVGVIGGLIKIYGIASLASLPLAVNAIQSLRSTFVGARGSVVKAMASTVSYSRLTGIILALGFLV